MKLNRLYDEFAHLWPLISAPEEYAVEAQHWRDALREKLGPGRHEILELGVGGGHNIAAGATIEPDQEEKFLNLVDEIVGKQMG